MIEFANSGRPTRAYLAPRAIKRILEDRVHNWLGEHGSGCLAPFRWLAGVSHGKACYLRLLMAEHRLSDTPRLTRLVRERLSDIRACSRSLVGPPQLYELPKDRTFRALVLSMPRVCNGRLQRGVMLIKFTETFRFFFHLIDVAALLHYFKIVLEPSWSGYCLPEVLFWTAYDEPVIVQASEQRDRQFLTELRTNLVPIPIGASDWVDYRVFHPLGYERTYDVIYVANLTPIKRVHVLLNALRIAARRGHPLRAIIVLSSWGGNQSAFEQMVDFYGVRSQVTVLMNLNHPQLNEWVNRARVSVLLSRKEGSNKTLFESMFAGTPVLLLKNNIGVNKDYINQHTGRLVNEPELADTLVELSRRVHPELSPREWALAHIAPELSTRKIEELLERLEPGRVALPLFVKVNSPEAVYMQPQEASGVPPLHQVLGCFMRSAGAGAAERFRGLMGARGVRL